MLTVDPPDHTRLRRLVSSAFSPRRIEGLRPRIQTVVDDLLDSIAADAPTAGSTSCPASRSRCRSPSSASCSACRARPRRARTRPDGHARADLDAGAVRGGVASDAVVALLERLVEVKRHPGDDLVSALIAARDGDERLDTRELLSTIFQLIVAGHDTTASFIGSVVALFRNPDQLALLRDPGRLDTALEEFLRFDAPSAALHVPVRRRTGRARWCDDPGGRRSSSAWRRRTRTSTPTSTPRCSTSTVRASATSPSGTASTTASVPRSPASKGASPWEPCCDASPAAPRRRRRRAAVGSRRRAGAPRLSELP